MNSMREDLDAAMANVVLSKEKRTAILEAMEKGEKPVKRVIRPIMVLAAVLALLTVSAFAVVPSLRELWTEALGGFLAYSQVVDGASDTDQGIEIRVVSAISDSTNTKIYLEVQDKTGDRLKNQDIRLSAAISRPNTEGGMWGSGSKCIGYDQESQTAMFELSHDGVVSTADGDTVRVRISKIQPGYHDYDLALPQELLSDRLLKTQRLDSGETVLKPGQTVYTFGGVDTLSLSSMGLAADGRFHLLLELKENVTECHILTTLRSKTLDDNDVDSYNEDIRTLDFTVGKRNYYEISMPFSQENLSDLRLDDLYGPVVDSGAIEGTWDMEVKLEQAAQRSFTIEEKINRITYHNITILPLALTMCGNPPSDGVVGYISHLPIAVVMADGTVLHPESAGGSYIWAGLSEQDPNGDRSLDRWVFDTPPDVEQVVGIAVGYWMIPLNGDTAGPGYWLSEMP
ncbi:MAG: DUF4179 domain-containing protein [Clostridia bacterium]|nr:DUF4179 domain-containing protein [Clostridia bacterium]